MSKQKEGGFSFWGSTCRIFRSVKPNMSNTISIGKVFFDLYIDYFFETSGTASCGTTGIYIVMLGD